MRMGLRGDLCLRERKGGLELRRRKWVNEVKIRDWGGGGFV
jgi:hypothetical protein